MGNGSWATDHEDWQAQRHGWHGLEHYILIIYYGTTRLYSAWSMGCL